MQADGTCATRVPSAPSHIVLRRGKRTFHWAEAILYPATGEGAGPASLSFHPPSSVCARDFKKRKGLLPVPNKEKRNV